MNLGNRIAVVLVAALTFGAALGTTPIDQIQADLSALKERANSDSEWKTQQAAAIADLLARQIALTATMNPDKKLSADWVAAADKMNVPADLQKAADNIKSGFTSLPADVKDLMTKCVTASATVKVANAADTGFELPQCDKDAREALKTKLQTIEKDARKAYDDCRQTIEEGAAEYRNLLPANASDRIDPNAFNAIKQYPNKRVRACADEVKKAIDALKDVRDAKALVSNALTMAANICFASGGNPWVCGGMLAIALIMEIFDGGGGGKGDGAGKGPPGGAGGGNAPTVSGAPPREGKSEGDARTAAGSKEIEQGPATNLGRSANLGDPNVVSNAFCNGAAGQITCFIKNTPESEVFFDGNERLTQLAKSPRPGAVTVCNDGQAKIKAIVVSDAGKFYLYVHNDKGTLPEEPVGSPQVACAKVKTQ